LNARDRYAAFNPPEVRHQLGGTLGGPIKKDKLFAFGLYEKQEDSRPLTTFTSNPGGVTPGGNTTRVNASDLSALSSFLSSRFQYETGPFDNITKLTPAKPWMLKGDYNINSANKVTFRYNQLDSSSPVGQNGSSALGTLSRQTGTTNFLGFQASNYAILENLRSGVGEWNSVFGTMTNNLLIGYTKQDESRDQIQLFPFVVIGDGTGSPYTTFGSEPFTPFNLLRYGTFQMQDSVTKFAKNKALAGNFLAFIHSPTRIAALYNETGDTPISWHSNSILGKWKIDIMRDSADNAIDITSTSGSEMPDIFPYLTFKKKKVLLQNGKSTWKGKWLIQDHMIVIDTESDILLSYQLIALTNDGLTLEHSLTMSDNGKMTIKIFYKKI
jgi:hypothetical protein